MKRWLILLAVILGTVVFPVFGLCANLTINVQNVVGGSTSLTGTWRVTLTDSAGNASDQYVYKENVVGTDVSFNSLSDGDYSYSVYFQYKDGQALWENWGAGFVSVSGDTATSFTRFMPYVSYVDSDSTFIRTFEGATFYITIQNNDSNDKNVKVTGQLGSGVTSTSGVVTVAANSYKDIYLTISDIRDVGRLDFKYIVESSTDWTTLSVTDHGFLPAYVQVTGVQVGTSDVQIAAYNNADGHLWQIGADIIDQNAVFTYDYPKQTFKNLKFYKNGVQTPLPPEEGRNALTAISRMQYDYYYPNQTGDIGYFFDEENGGIYRPTCDWYAWACHSAESMLEANRKGIYKDLIWEAITSRSYPFILDDDSIPRTGDLGTTIASSLPPALAQKIDRLYQEHIPLVEQVAEVPDWIEKVTKLSAYAESVPAVKTQLFQEGSAIGRLGDTLKVLNIASGTALKTVQYATLTQYAATTGLAQSRLDSLQKTYAYVKGVQPSLDGVIQTALNEVQTELSTESASLIASVKSSFFDAATEELLNNADWLKEKMIPLATKTKLFQSFVGKTAQVLKVNQHVAAGGIISAVNAVWTTVDLVAEPIKAHERAFLAANLTKVAQLYARDSSQYAEGKAGTGNILSYSALNKSYAKDLFDTLTVFQNEYYNQLLGLLDSDWSNVLSNAINESITFAQTGNSLSFASTALSFGAEIGKIGLLLRAGDDIKALKDEWDYVNNKVTIRKAAMNDWSEMMTAAGRRKFLTVTKFGAGSGTVTSDQPGINCGTLCSATYDSGVLIKLSAAAQLGSTFDGWQGCTDGTTGQDCYVKMDSARNVTAMFTPVRQLTVNSTNPASGVSITVTPNDNSNIGNGTTQFTLLYHNNAFVTLAAPSTAGSNKFGAWTGCDSAGGTNGSECYLTMTSDKNVTANYILDAARGHDVGIISTPPELSLQTSSESVHKGSNIVLSAFVKNYGIYKETNIQVKFAIKDPTGQLIQEQTQYVTLEANTTSSKISKTFTVNQTEGVWEASVTIETTLDENQANNKLKKMFYVGDPPTYTGYNEFSAGVVVHGAGNTTSSSSGYSYKFNSVTNGKCSITISNGLSTVGTYSVSDDSWNLFDANKLLVNVLQCNWSSDPDMVALTDYSAVPGLALGEGITPEIVSVEAGGTATFRVNTNSTKRIISLASYSNSTVISQNWYKGKSNVSGDNTDFDIKFTVPLAAPPGVYDIWVDSDYKFIQKIQIKVIPPHNLRVNNISSVSNQYRQGEIVNINSDVVNPGGYDESSATATLTMTGPNGYTFKSSQSVSLLKNNTETKTLSFQWNTSLATACTLSGCYSAKVSISSSWPDMNPDDNISQNIAINITSNTPPSTSASIQNPQTTYNVNERIYFVGTGIDAENDSLIYSWSIVAKPAASAANLSTTNTQNTYLIPDVVGIYIVQLQVADGLLVSSPTQVKVEVVDITPVQFVFADITGVDADTPIVSNQITVGGITAPSPISILDGAYSINGSPFTSSIGTVNNSDNVRVKITSSSSFLTKVDSILTIGGVSDTFSVTTRRDNVSPAVVTNLNASISGNIASLTWTAPGDDGNVGTASAYDIRYSVSPITEGNYASATQISSLSPQAAGQPESLSVNVTDFTCGTTYFFTLKTSDEVLNVSPISNIASVTTPSCPENGTCGTASGHVYSYVDTDWGSYTACSSGIGSFPPFPAAGSSSSLWTCSGSNGGSSVTNCQASRTKAPISGVCGSANGKSFTTAPTTDLCASGNAEPVPTGTGPWNWLCKGSTPDLDVSCGATQQQIQAGNLFLDEFSGDLSKWDIWGGGDWQIINGKLQGHYTQDCGSIWCSQSTIYLKDQYQPTIADFSVEVTSSYTPYIGWYTYYRNQPQITFMSNLNNQLNFFAGGGGDVFSGPQSTINVGVSRWDGSQHGYVYSNWNIPYSWVPDQDHVFRVVKQGNNFDIYFDGTKLGTYVDTYLPSGPVKVGLHVYGTQLHDNFKIDQLPASKKLLYLKPGDPASWTVAGNPGNQSTEIQKWLDAGYLVDALDKNVTTITADLLRGYSALRVENYGWAIPYADSEGAAVYDWVRAGGKALLSTAPFSTVPLVRPFGVSSIEGTSGTISGWDWNFIGSPMFTSDVAGPIGPVSPLAAEAMEKITLANSNSLTVDATVSGYPAAVHGASGNGKVVINFLSGWSHTVSFPGNGLQSNINQGSNLAYLQNVIQYLGTNEAVNGTCGIADRKAFAAAPTTDLCSYGNPEPSVLSGSGPWNWTCKGVDGGADASCSASIFLIGDKFTQTSSMGSTRENHTATLLKNGQVLVVGWGEGDPRPELYGYQTGSFSPTGDMVQNRTVHAATLLTDGRVLITGGQPSPYYSEINSAELYDPGIGTFSTTGSMIDARRGHSSTLLSDGKVLVAGGYNGSYLNSAELFDPATGLFSATGSMTESRYLPMATALSDGKVLVTGGGNDPSGAAITSAELYDPATGTFTATGSMVEARYDQTSTLLPNGKVLVAGGYNLSTYYSSAELFDPATGIFTPTGNMGTPRRGHEATLLSNGMVLITGGHDGNGVLKSAEVYDPATGSFSPAGTMIFSRIGGTATLLPNSKVLLTGGTDYNAYHNSSELFDGVASSPVNASCGVADGNAYETSTFNALTATDLCASGTLDQRPSSPGPWTCNGIGGGDPSSCTAYLKTTASVPIGTNVSVPTDSPVNITFNTVITPGTLQATATAGPGANVTLANGATLDTVPGSSYDITSTAGTTGPITVCLGYSEAGLSVTETILRLLHYNGTVWEDITTTVDAANNRVCGQTTSLSPFVIGYRREIKPGDADGSGSISISEVQSAINMYLGLKSVESSVDTDLNGVASIAEVQKVINGYLGL